MSDKKVILITGASSGIGMASAVFFAKQGWNVAATMRNPKSLKEFEDYTNIKLFGLDVTSVDSIKNAVEDVLKTYLRIDVLFNNAGYALAGPFEAISDEEVRKQFETNLFGVMNVTRAVLPHFRAQKSGIILNTTSSGGNLTFPLYSIYISTKWALEGFMEALQYELRPFNIVVKNLAPGSVKSEFTNSTSFVSNSVYDKYANKVQGNIIASYQMAPDADTVAKVAFKAATDNKIKLRYPATMQARMGFFLRWLLPLQIFNKMVAAPFEKDTDK
ncbi:SDR family oxidoreductase [Pedobacter hartonius]|uniref:NADP-dependent 3-hydroxy acid dehydrogenase YdfG n=1 Tax=Pedobacter hartonius TaxID=425514 RepID=A0A1H3VYB6_9SPHI|nr:SDR family oxidoreductase [Pedobacter hartonius]SDZ79799.1 NADP-dependent 3-hydroxy acid dehydrogenase YdfG [Pedobacter hartonius]